MGDAVEEFEGINPESIYLCIEEDIAHKKITPYSSIRVICYKVPYFSGLYYATDWLEKYSRYRRFSENG